VYVNETALLDGDEADDMENAERCLICSDIRKYSELWFRSKDVKCGFILSAEVRTMPVTMCVPLLFDVM
jgi:hypothetical protein